MTEDFDMPFMRPQTRYDRWLITDDDCIPEGYVTELKDALNGEVIPGWCARLSAPGYMDRTDWVGPFDTELEAALELERMYRYDDADEDEAEAEMWDTFLEDVRHAK
jgi:hypothetical protein